MEWGDEQLPANAFQRRASNGRDGGLLGRRERRSQRVSPRNSRRASDRQVARLTADHQTEEDRSRSRSRSPKRLNNMRQSSGLRINPRASHESNLNSRRVSLKDASSRQSDTIEPSERTPLLSSSPEQNDPTDRKILRTPSWFRSSGVSGTTTKFQVQGYGTSTFWQSWFNTVNALIGVGILALPLAISYAGIILGVLLFIFCGLVTNYTGKVLAHIMSAEPSLRTYADIGNFAFGLKARFVVTLFFTVELWAVSTALIILFGDSAKALVTSSVGEHGAHGILETMANWPPAVYKAFGTLIVLPTMFLPLKFLSPISVVGIISIVSEYSSFTVLSFSQPKKGLTLQPFTALFLVVLSDGLVKKHGPGSLWEPAHFNWGPQWSRLPLSFGLVMSGFSTHPIVPSIFKDMKNPADFRKMLNWAYLAAACIYLSMGLVGYIMFGNAVTDEITRDLARTKGYPKIFNKIAIWLIIINPLSKFALAARPIDTTLEILLGVEDSQVLRPPRLQSTRSGKLKYLNVDVEQSKGGLVAEAATEAAAAQQEGDIEEDPTTPRPGASSSAFTLGPQMENGERGPQQSPLADSAISVRAAQRTANWSRRSKFSARILIQTAVTILIGGTAIVLPGFEAVMAFLGAFLACATCVFGPLLANLRLLHHEMSRFNIILDVIILLIFTVIAALGTVWSFLPLS